VGFNAYVELLGAVDTAAAVWGGLWLFPVFLFWLYVLWLIVLFGVELAYVIQRREDLLEAERRRLEGEAFSRRHPDALFALQCLLVVARRFASGGGPVDEPTVTHALASDPLHVRNALETLEDAGILAESPSGYLPARPLDQVSVREVIRQYRAHTRPATGPRAPGADVVDAIVGAPGERLDETLAGLVKG